MDTRIAVAALSAALISMVTTASAEPPAELPAAQPGPPPTVHQRAEKAAEQPIRWPCGRNEQPDDEPCTPDDEWELSPRKHRSAESARELGPDHEFERDQELADYEADFDPTAYDAARYPQKGSSSKRRSTGAMVGGIVVTSLGGAAGLVGIVTLFMGGAASLAGGADDSLAVTGGAIAGVGFGTALVVGVPLIVWGAGKDSRRSSAEFMLTPGGMQMTGTF